jgi:hypothetical protein
MGYNEKSIKTKVINVAILAEEPLGWDSGKHYFPVILNNYEWKIDNTIYKFSTRYIKDKEITKGKLNIAHYDVLLVPGGGVGDGESIIKGFNILRRVKKWKKNISGFIKNGGGYVGICGGAALMTSLNNGYGKKPITFTERQYNKSAIGVSCVSSYYKDLAIPLLYPFQCKYPEKIGAMAYVFSFAPGETIDSVRIHSAGIPLDFQISKDNPIFSDYSMDTLRMRWWGGPALIVPEKPNREVKVLARYPNEEISKNKNTRIWAWRYIGNIYGLVTAFFKTLKMIKNENIRLKNVFLYSYYLAGNWEKTDKLIELNFSNKPCMTAEIYPNEKKGRILLCTTHPEYLIWYGGHIEEVDNRDFNCLASGFHKWKNISPFSKTFADELTHTWWIVRRMVAWAAKIPDNHLPPISKDQINEKERSIISKNILWNGSIIDQMKNI